MVLFVVACTLAEVARPRTLLLAFVFDFFSLLNCPPLRGEGCGTEMKAPFIPDSPSSERAPGHLASWKMTPIVCRWPERSLLTP
jgi:hypothetical protein